MRIINVIVIKDGVVHNIESFVVFEEQLSEDVVEQAEESFANKVLELVGMNEDDFNDTFDDMDTYIENGIFEMKGYYCVCLTWSDI